MLVVAAFESRSETASIFTMDTFNSSRMNMIAAAEIAGAYLITHADFLQRLLGTTSLTSQQWGVALLAAVVLLVCWEIAKWIARRSGAGVDAGRPGRALSPPPRRRGCSRPDP